MERVMFMISDSLFGRGDSFSDKISNRYTVFILGTFAMLMTGRQYVSAPMYCYCDKQQTKEQCEYVNQVYRHFQIMPTRYCYTHNNVNKVLSLSINVNRYCHSQLIL